MKKLLVMVLAAMMTVAMTGCGEEPPAEPVQTQPQIVAQQKEVKYYEPEEEAAPLVPKTKLKLGNVNYARATVNTEVVNLNTVSLAELLAKTTLTLDSGTTHVLETSDFRFIGFALKSGDSIQMYAELVDADGELVTEYDAAKKDTYSIKALCIGTDWLTDEAMYNYITYGARIFLGLSKEEVEQTDGKGYTSGYDVNTFYYPTKDNTLVLKYAPKTQIATDENGAETEQEILALNEIIFIKN